MSSSPARGAGVLIGCAVMAAATACFATMHAAARLAATDLHPFEVAFFRNLFGFFVIAPWFWSSGLAPLRTQRLGMHALRAAINIFAMLAFFYALTISPLVEVQALGFTAPLFVTAFAGLLLGERVTLGRWAAVLVGFSGALIIIRPGFQPVGLGAMLTLASAAAWACALLVIKRLSATDSAITITSYMVIFMTALSLVPALFVWQWPDLVTLGWLFACGILGTMAQLLMTQSLRFADASVVLQLDFLKVIWGSMLGYYLFGEVLGVWTWIGAAVIVAGTAYLTYSEHRAAS